MRFEPDSGKIFLNWDDIHIAASGIAHRIEQHGYQPKRILAVARGGLIPAALLSHQLGVKEVGSLQLESYEGQERDKIRMYKQLDLNVIFPEVNNFQYWGCHAAYWDKPDTLVVDDLWDTGETHRWIREMYPNVVTTTLFYKDKPENSDSAHRIVSFPGAPLGNYWVVFPWEKG